jgi:outer membrane lipoprotein-sorting protein
MTQLAAKPSERATFVEKKTIALLDKPVESSGELRYKAPNLLEKRTLKPKAEMLRIDGDTLTFERGKKTQQVSLADYPEIAGFVDSIRGTLAGDRKALERSFQLALDGNPERWSLALTPTEPKMSELIRKIVIGGRRGDVRSIEIQQADGDRSLMTVERVGE